MKLYNKRIVKTLPANTVNIMRPSIFGNPYSLGNEDDRDKICNLYHSYCWKKVLSEPSFYNAVKDLYGKNLYCCCAPKQCHGESLIEISTILHNMDTDIIKWNRRNGYECSSNGDRRFSAFCAKLKDGRSIEQHYQCDIKGYDIGGTNWRLGKGKPALNNKSSKELYKDYRKLWAEYFVLNPSLITELYNNALSCNNTLSDMFATSEINQARALSEILNGWIKYCEKKSLNKKD